LNGARNGNGNGAIHGNHAAAPAEGAEPDLPTE